MHCRYQYLDYCLKNRHDLVELVALQMADEVLRPAFIGPLGVFFQEFLDLVLAAGVHPGGDGRPDARSVVHLGGRHQENRAVLPRQRRGDAGADGLDVFCDLIHKRHSMIFPS